MFIRLKKNWPGGQFARTPRDGDGKPLGDRIVFAAGQPVEVPDGWRDSFAGDIGPALEVMEAPAVLPVESEPAASDESPADPNEQTPTPRRRRPRE